ncbi:unnamed protein product [Rotaria sordida]|uniref:Uncharacterized protein n=1 Tax=Rotaria sordida TaxID=392033 RepID=A0A814LLY9_9BILA|nr:unnamed protein product [Rotaria sordida]
MVEILSKSFSSHRRGKYWQHFQLSSNAYSEWSLSQENFLEPREILSHKYAKKHRNFDKFLLKDVIISY